MGQPDFRNLLAFLEETPEFIRSLTENLTASALRQKPDPEEFSFLQHVCHLRDIEQEGYCVRIARILSEERPVLANIDGDALAAERNYNSEAFAEALKAFTRARRNNIEAIKTSPPDQLNRTGIFDGAATTLEQLLVMMQEHDVAHRRALSNLRS